MIRAAAPPTVEDTGFERVAIFRDCCPTIPLGSTDDLRGVEGAAKGTCGGNGGTSKTGRPCRNKSTAHKPRCRLHPHTHVEIDVGEHCDELRVSMIDCIPQDLTTIQPKDIFWIDCPDRQCFYLYPIVTENHPPNP